MFKTTRSSAPSLDDEEILRREAEWARHAMAEAGARLQQGLVKAADPTAWARKHPLATVGAAAAAGFLTARAMNTSREEKLVLRYWKAMRAGNGAGAASSSAGTERAAAATMRGGGIMAGLMSVVQTAVAQLPTILSQLQAHSAMEQKEAATQDAAAQAAAAASAPRGTSYEPPLAEPVNGY